MPWEGCNGTRVPIHLCATSLGVQVKAGAGRQGRPLTQLQTELSAGFTKELHLICVGKELEKSKAVQSPGIVLANSKACPWVWPEAPRLVGTWLTEPRGPSGGL